MTPRQKQRLLFIAAATAFVGLSLLYARRGPKPRSPLWGIFAGSLLAWFVWADLIAAARLRHRAFGEPIIGIDSGDADEIIKGNPWAARHHLLTAGRLQRQAEEIAAVEKIYLDAKAVTMGRILRGRIEGWERGDFTPIWRLDLIKNDAIGTITAKSEALQLADPLVGQHFYFGEYRHRDDQRVRPTHRAMGGFIAALNWEGWLRAFPPAGHHCRCYRRIFTRAESISRGWMTEDGKPKFQTKWPNSLAKINWETGMFPDRNWIPPLLYNAPPVAAAG